MEVTAKDLKVGQRVRLEDAKMREDFGTGVVVSVNTYVEVGVHDDLAGGLVPIRWSGGKYTTTPSIYPTDPNIVTLRAEPTVVGNTLVFPKEEE